MALSEAGPVVEPGRQGLTIEVTTEQSSPVKGVKISNRAKITAVINGVKVQALLDTGADFTFVTEDFLKGVSGYSLNKLQTSKLKKVVTADANDIGILGMYPVDIKVGRHKYSLEAYVVKKICYH